MSLSDRGFRCMTAHLPCPVLILETLERERDRDATHFASLDTKAGLILGFSSAPAALTPSIDSVAGSLTVVLAIAAAALATAAFGRGSRRVLDPGALRRHLAAESAFTKLTIVDTKMPQSNNPAIPPPPPPRPDPSLTAYLDRVKSDDPLGKKPQSASDR